MLTIGQYLDRGSSFSSLLIMNSRHCVTDIWSRFKGGLTLLYLQASLFNSLLPKLHAHLFLPRVTVWTRTTCRCPICHLRTVVPLGYHHEGSSVTLRFRTLPEVGLSALVWLRAGFTCTYGYGRGAVLTKLTHELVQPSNVPSIPSETSLKW